jgi:hypothetical protein
VGYHQQIRLHCHAKRKSAHNRSQWCAERSRKPARSAAEGNLNLLLPPEADREYLKAKG